MASSQQATALTNETSRNRKLPPRLQQAPSRDKGDNSFSLDIYGHHRTPNISPKATERNAEHHKHNKKRDLTGSREAEGRSNGQQSINQRHCPNKRDFGRNRKSPPRLQQAVSRDKGDNFVSPDIYGHPRTPNISPTSTERDAEHHQQNKRRDLMDRREAGGRSNGQQSTNQCQCPNERDLSRNRKITPCLQ
jgi:hypothetical protein